MDTKKVKVSPVLNSVKTNNATSLPRCTPESVGIASSAIVGFLEAISEAKIELHSLMIVKKGQVAVEGWWAPYRSDLKHQLFSLSKSFTSTAIGFAVQENLLTIQDTVISFFEKKLPNELSENLKKMTLKDLLTMSSGHDFDTVGPMTNNPDSDWVKNFLSLQVAHEPGTHFLYNTGATYMLSAIIQEVTGLTLLDYLKPRLFEPLGFEDTTWDRCPMGRNVGGWGLNLHTEDIAKFGVFLLNKGAWKGEQLLSSQWIEEATSKQIENGDEGDNEWSHGYGYQFWRCRHNAFRGDGAFGQYCLVLPDQESVIAITSAVDDMQVPINLIWEHLLPELNKLTNLDIGEDYDTVLKKIDSLAIEPMLYTSIVPSLKDQTHLVTPTYELEHNELGIQSLAFDFNKGLIAIKTGMEKITHELGYGKELWHLGQMKLFELPLMQGITYYAASGSWDINEFVLTIRLLETPVYETWRCRFDQNTITIKRRVNVSFGPKELPDLVGKE